MSSFEFLSDIIQQLKNFSLIQTIHIELLLAIPILLDYIVPQNLIFFNQFGNNKKYILEVIVILLLLLQKVYAVCICESERNSKTNSIVLLQCQTFKVKTLKRIVYSPGFAGNVATKFSLQAIIIITQIRFILHPSLPIAFGTGFALGDKPGYLLPTFLYFYSSSIRIT